MSGNKEKTEKGQGKQKTLAFRLSEEEDKDLTDVSNTLARGVKTDFIRNAIRFFKENPDLYGQGTVNVAESQVTKEDLEELKGDLFHQLNQNLSFIQEMTQLLLDQKENGRRATRINDIKTILLEHTNLAELDTYGKIEQFLVEELPELKDEIVENRIYNDVLFELMQEGHVIYNQRSKKLNWRGIKK
ncbi:MAG: hypothetical protein ACFE8J_08835 [Candidatus Heimdallarchaeota archaeon]